MNFPSHLIKRAVELIILSRTRNLSAEELQELQDILAELGSEDEALLNNFLDQSWLRDAYESIQKAEQSKEETLKKIWEKINGEGK